uniref:Calcium-dependent protein kinase n=1 Tax=Tetraselmis chuii TaxID=63592 RepID=A0A7S1X9N0_9CHLO|mmetsp:Transcript_6825/g.12362  ORF Transcript_6825/g.12362 Transcript_6825/m.12362 type:complete len:600 (+) Transcript_6825:286-2085(+)|eukprot:CAMPEP_0177767596 /NCGR_PEP_ID=MMETSP0491_2-20121128/9211_1 /TAXON_ID=63592 /ORGANISM="Tetraselmis chuii, Strain PLY429" /LENGTH=599 /DNA_ID=CAMNT_0019284225 /DNA_START=362 /DNA_END=2161 /DNA_ORIENTATION=-
MASTRVTAQHLSLVKQARGQVARLLKGPPSVTVVPTAVRPQRTPQRAGTRLVVFSQQTRSKRDYSASATDKVILRLPPGHELSADDVKVVFDYPRNLTDRYDLKEKIGAGSFGIVVRAVDKETGIEYACKSIAKIPSKQVKTNPHHLLKIRSEVDCMQTLGASLDAVFLKDVFEDDSYVHMVMELCLGGPLIESMDVSNLTEARVAELIRSILRFLAQCHAKGLIFRDVKPGNFLYATKDEGSSLKATDFGLMIQHSKNEPPLTTRAGTPVYLAPEVVTRNYDAAADVYSVGVLCFQLLTGRFPYWPSNNFKAPTMNELFDMIAQARIDFSTLEKEGVSPSAVDLLKKLLMVDPKRRITALEALKHPWVQEGGAASDAPLSGTVVQRLQRFAVNGHLKQYVLNMITEDIMGSTEVMGMEETAEMITPLRDMFARLDKDGSGDVSVDELVAGLIEQGYSLSEPEVEQLVTRMDVNKDGKIVFDEFATCLLDWPEFRSGNKWQKLVRRAFDKLDLNGDGYISLDELMALLPEFYDTEEKRKEAASAMMREFDNSTDGLISWAEFDNMLSDMSNQNALEYFDKRYTAKALDDGENLEVTFTG